MATPLPLRRAIQDRFHQGQDAATIARAVGVPLRTVQNLLARFRRQPDALAPSYRPGPGRPTTTPPFLEQALALRQEHPTWGAGYIRLRLSGEPDPSLPG